MPLVFKLPQIMLYLITFSYQMQTFMTNNKQSEIIQLLYKYIYKKAFKILKMKISQENVFKSCSVIQYNIYGGWFYSFRKLVI